MGLRDLWQAVKSFQTHEHVSMQIKRDGLFICSICAFSKHTCMLPPDMPRQSSRPLPVPTPCSAESTPVVKDAVQHDYQFKAVYSAYSVDSRKQQ